jgi:hypothetical protein
VADGAEDARLHFHGLEWNTVPSLTGLPFDAQIKPESSPLATIRAGTQNAAGYTLNERIGLESSGEISERQW